MITDREIPHSKESEQAVLGAVFLVPRLLADLADVRTDDFFFPAHREILDAMRAVEAVDAITVGDEMKRRGMIARMEGGEAYFLTLSNAGSDLMFPHHLAIVREKALARRLIMACGEAMARAYNGTPVVELIADHRLALASLELDGKDGGPVRIADSIDGAMDYIEAKAQSPERYSVGTGLADFDERIGGMRAGHLVIVAGLPGQGKCLGLGTSVLMFDGTRTPVEEVRSGDLLMGPDSQPRRVLSTARGRGPLFRINPTKGDPWVCNDVHVMTTTRLGKVTDIPLNVFMQKSKAFQERSKLIRVGVDFPGCHALPVAPYFLGLVIGDGSVAAGGVRLCKPDEEVADECRQQAEIWGLRYRSVVPSGKAKMHYLVGKHGGRRLANPLFVALRDLGLEVDCASKRVPPQYLTTARDQRLELLAGLIDSDGHLECGGFDWISASSGLADDVLFLARSLGLAAYKAECRKGCQTGAIGTYYRVFISGHIASVPTRISRKKAAPRRQAKNVLHTGFSVEPIGDGEYAGFELDGDGRFLLGDFTITHNTSFAEGVALYNGARGVPVLIFSLEMKRQELIERALSSESGIDGRKIVSARLDYADWRDGLMPAAKKLREAWIWIDDRKLSTSRICSEAMRWREMVRRLKAKDATAVKDDRALVAIDYLGLVRSDGRHENRNLEVAAMSAAFKGLAGDLDCPVILLSQLNRSSAKDRRKPVPSDLRDSGAVEADADMIVFPWRPELDDEHRGTPPDVMDAQIIVAKNRNGPTGEIDVRWKPSTTQFLDRDFDRWKGPNDANPPRNYVDTDQ